MMFFSVIIPVYNVEKYLHECVDSVLRQDFTDFEIILVDDGSTDGSGKICDEYTEKDSRIIVSHKENGGASAARNEGLKIARGEYVVYLDSDDYINRKDFLSLLFQKALTKPDVIIYKFCKYYENEKRMGKCSYGFPLLDNYKTLPEKLRYLIKCDSFYCAAWSKAIKRSVLVDNNIEFKQGIIAEDQDWYYHVLTYVSSMEGIDEQFLIYRQRNNSVTSVQSTCKLKNLTDCLYVISKWNERIKISESIEREYRDVLLNSLAKLYCNLLVAYSRYRNNEKKQYYETLKEMRYLFKYDLNPRVCKFKLLNRLLGFRGLLFILEKIS